MNNLSNRRELSLDDMRNIAPSIFAVEPFGDVSKSYKFIPTSEVLEQMIKEGFVPMMATECRVRNASKKGFAKHMIKLRHNSFNKDLAVGDEIPEVVLTNSHDRTSAYTLQAGIFRLVCSNGLVVASETFERLSVKHIGNQAAKVIEGSFKIIEELPEVMTKVEAWKSLIINPEQQLAFAKSAVEISPSTLQIAPNQLLVTRRREDEADSNGNNSLYKTFNVIQENLSKGGIPSLKMTKRGNNRHTRSVNAIDADMKLNKALWTLTEEMSKLVG